MHVEPFVLVRVDVPRGPEPGRHEDFDEAVPSSGVRTGNLHGLEHARKPECLTLVVRQRVAKRRAICSRHGHHTALSDEIDLKTRENDVNSDRRSRACGGRVCRTSAARSRRWSHGARTGFERGEIRENGGDVLVCHAAEGVPRHDLVDRSRLGVPRAHHLGEQRHVVVGNAARVRREVGAGHPAPRAVEDESAGELQAGDRLAVIVLRRVAFAARAEMVTR